VLIQPESNAQDLWIGVGETHEGRTFPNHRVGRRWRVGREGTPVLTVVNADGSTPNSSLIEIVREGVRRMLAAALEAEVNSYIAELADQRDGNGRRLVVRNGYHQPRKVTTVAGAVEVRALRVDDKRTDEASGERRRFSSAILPPWCRKSPKISEVLPLLYLHGLSSGDFVPALEQFLGSAAGLSPAAVTRLTALWQADHGVFQDRDLSASDYVYVWADGVHLRIHLEEAKAAVLVLIGVRADGTKELIAMTDGYRESSEAWAGLLRDCARRGMRAPGPGRRRRHARLLERAERGVPRNPPSAVLGSQNRKCTRRPPEIRPARGQARGPGDLQREDKEHAARAIRDFGRPYGAKYPKVVKRITDDEDELLAFFDFPAEHWVHLRTTNPIESTFSTVRLQTKVTRGAGSRSAALAMVFKLIESAQARWRAVNAPHLVALMRAGARFERGHLVERRESAAA
jgi:transposase-like protein